MNKINSEFLKEVLSVNTCSNKEEQMVAFLDKNISLISPSALVEHTEEGNILVTKKQTGHTDYLPCVVAHMDTVHEIYEGFKVIQKADNLSAVQRYGTNKVSLAGIGGDDKVGVYLALEMLRHFDNIKIAFFTNEEIGCVGSNAVDLEWFKDTSFVIQGDRRGNNEIIYSDMNGVVASDEFIEDTRPIATRHGYRFSDQGSYTDATTMSGNGLCVSAYNIACGYYNAHTVKEFVVISDVAKSMDLFIDLIQTLTCDSNKQYLHDNTSESDEYGYQYGYDDYYGHEDYYSEFSVNKNITPPLSNQERQMLSEAYGSFALSYSDEELINWYYDDIQLHREERGDSVDTPTIEEGNIAQGYSIEGDVFAYGNNKIILPADISCSLCQGKAYRKQYGYKPGSYTDALGGCSASDEDSLEYVCNSCGEILVDEYTLMDYLDNLTTTTKN